MRRRQFITLACGAAVWPLAALAQPDRLRRIGVLMNTAEDDPQSKARASAFVRGLQERGWTLGGNVQIEYRWGAGSAKLYYQYASELAATAPDVVLASGGTAVGALQQITRTIPIVFVGTTDPVNRGLVASMARPGGNTTGFVEFEFSLSGKWLELLKQIMPNVSRVVVVRNPSLTSGVGQMAAVQTAAASFGIETTPVDSRDIKELKRMITAFARPPRGGMIVTLSGTAIDNRQAIIEVAAQNRLPTIYPDRIFVADGGLIAYGPDPVHHFQAAASYVDRILKGEKAGELPVQAPTKYDLAINLKTAVALGLTIPQELLARANEVIE